MLSVILRDGAEEGSTKKGQTMAFLLAPAAILIWVVWMAAVQR